MLGLGMEFRDGAKGQRAIPKPNPKPPHQKWNSVVPPGLEVVAGNRTSEEADAKQHRCASALVEPDFKAADADKADGTAPPPPLLFQAASLGSRHRAEN